MFNDNVDKFKQQHRQLVSTTCARINSLERSRNYKDNIDNKSDNFRQFPRGCYYNNNIDVQTYEAMRIWQIVRAVWRDKNFIQQLHALAQGDFFNDNGDNL